MSAINRAGQGSPSDPTAPLLVKALNAPPKIDRKVLGESQSVKASSLNGYFKKIFGLFLSVSADGGRRIKPLTLGMKRRAICNCATTASLWPVL